MPCWVSMHRHGTVNNPVGFFCSKQVQGAEHVRGADKGCSFQQLPDNFSVVITAAVESAQLPDHCSGGMTAVLGSLLVTLSTYILLHSTLADVPALS